jgi:Eukaryotic aspartyl protease
MFGEVEEMFRYTSRYDSSWDGLLGLAPSNENADSLGLMNPFQNMVAQNLLNRNLFSLKLPRGADDRGEILFGEIDHDLYVGELKALPLLSYDRNHSEETKGRWAVAAMRMSIGDGSFDFDDGVAVFETDFPFIGLPENYAMLLDQYLGMDNAGKSWEHLRSIDCKKRKMLENITITLGEEDFVISPWEYTIEVDMSDLGVSGKRCVSAFMPKEGYGDDNYIVLGSAFLKAFYGVFDLDARTISCEFLLANSALIFKV